MHSGYMLVYGISFRNLDELLSFFKKFCYGTSLSQLVDINSDDLEISDRINAFLSSEGYVARIHKKSCCFNNGIYYFGYMLGASEIIYPNLDECHDFFKYRDDIQYQLDKISQNYKMSDFDSIRKLYNNRIKDEKPFDEEFHLLFHKYWYSNNCYLCLTK